MTFGANWLLVDDVGEARVARTAAGQMAADLAMVDAVHTSGRPMLRCYTWTGPALSIGRFQPDDEIDDDACMQRGVEVVRRPTGGRALLHGHDLTYAVAVPRPAGLDGSVDAIYCELARGLRAGLAHFGLEAVVANTDGDTGGACFASMRGSDLRVGGKKLCGSAQVHRGGVVLQHGSVWLDRFAFDETDVLRYGDEAARERERARLRATTVTMRELGVVAPARAVADAVIDGFASALGVNFSRSSPDLLSTST